MSGMKIKTPYPDLPIFEFFMVQDSLTADSIAIKPWEQILKINLTKSMLLKINGLIEVFKSK